MNCKRGASLLALNFSGPQASALFNEVDDEIIVRLTKFNAWVGMFNALNPKPWMQQERCTWVCFTRFTRDLILRWCDAEQCWELEAIKRPEGDEGGCAAPPPEPQGGSGGGDSVELILSGGFHLPERPLRPEPPRRRRRAAGKAAKRPAKKGRAAAGVAAERAVAAASVAKRQAERIVLRTRALLRSARRSPRFRHIASQFEASIAEMKAVGRLSRDTVGALAHAAHDEIARAIAGVRSLFIEPREPATCTQAYLESCRIEIRPGFTLVLYNFDSADRPNWDAWLFGKLEIEIDYPNWESWLFGKPVEDEQKVA